MRTKHLFLAALILFFSSAFAGTKYEGKIFNMQGPEAAAWDLSGNKSKYLAENDLQKDIINTTSISDRLPFFRREVKSGNGSTFVKIQKKKLMDPSYENLDKLYSSSKPQKSIRNIKAGDLYLVKIASSNNYAILTISQIKDDKTSRLYGGNNLDYISFQYEVFAYAPPQATSWNKSNPTTPEDMISDQEPSVVIFPNPIQTDVFVSLQNLNLKNWTVKIENTKGEVMYESIEPIKGNQWNHNIAAMASGRYILTIYSNDEMYLQKIIDKESATLSDNQ